MKFVKGVPFKDCKAPSWYLYNDGSLETCNYIINLVNSNLGQKLRNPHIENDDVSKGLFVTAIAKMSISILLGERNGFYVGHNGGMCPTLFEITEERESDSWPNAPRIKISRWPMGKHYYAKVDGIDVVDSKGNQKWKTSKAAEKAAKQFMKSIGS